MQKCRRCNHCLNTLAEAHDLAHIDPPLHEPGSSAQVVRGVLAVKWRMGIRWRHIAASLQTIRPEDGSSGVFLHYHGMYSDFTIYVPRVHIPDARWLDGRVRWTRPKRGGPISEADRSRSSGGWGRREGESRSAGKRGWREGRAALGLRRAGIAPGEKGTLRRGMVRGGRVEWGKAPSLKFNATYLSC